MGLHKRLIIDADDETILVSGEDLKDVSLAYATTVHKAQGSECNVAIILLANEPKSLLRNDLFYVASTRAKKKNILIVQNDGTNAMEKAITTTWVLNRKSGLSTRIKIQKENEEEKEDGIK